MNIPSFVLTHNDSRLSEKVLDTATEREFCVLQSAEFRDQLIRNRAAIKEYSGLLAEKESEILETAHASGAASVSESDKFRLQDQFDSYKIRLNEHNNATYIVQVC